MVRGVGAAHFECGGVEEDNEYAGQRVLTHHKQINGFWRTARTADDKRFGVAALWFCAQYLGHNVISAIRAVLCVKYV